MNKSSNSLRVSVVLPVFNGQETIESAISSILNQTWHELELIIIDDGSSDSSVELIRNFSDSRIRFFRNPSNQGLPSTLNRGISAAEGQFIARQDQDDISIPERIASQIDFLDRHPKVVLVGAWAKIVQGIAPHDFHQTGRHKHPTSNSILGLRLMWSNPFVHSSVMFRKDAFKRAGEYSTDEVTGWPEDYELWSRMSQQGELANISEYLVVYRESQQGMSQKFADRIRDGVLRVANSNYLGIGGAQEQADDWAYVVSILNGFQTEHRGLQACPRYLRLFLKVALIKNSMCDVYSWPTVISALTRITLRCLKS